MEGSAVSYGRAEITVKTLITAILFATLLGGLAQAQSYEFGVLGGYSRFSHSALGSASPVEPNDYDTRIKTDHSIGAWIGLNTRGYYGHEFNYQITYADLTSTIRTTTNDVTTAINYKDRIAIHRLSYDFLIYFMPNGSRWRPYVSAGPQANQYQSPNIAGWPYGGGRRYGINYGGGIKLIPVHHTLFRLDFRDYYGGKPYNLTFASGNGGWIHTLEASAGFALTF